MKKILFAIFAHPDDETFGPAGTLLKLKGEGYDIHLILLTDGEAGTNPDNVADLGAVRIDEWESAAKIVGISSANAFHYADDELEKTDMSVLEKKVAHTISGILHTYKSPVELSFMTFEPQGLTGHRDHIAASKLTTKLAAQFKAHAIWYYCLDSTQAPLDGTAYYEPRARKDSYITHKIDVSPWLDQKYQMMDAHVSQRQDAANMKKLGLSIENFHVDVLN